MKVLYLPLNTPQTIQTGMYDAFNDIGVDLHIFDFYQKSITGTSATIIREEFINMVDNLQPNLVHMQLQFTNEINSETIIAAKRKSPKTIFTNWTGDIRTNVPGEFIDISRVVDYSLISSVGQIDMYLQAGCKNVKYWQIGYNPKLYFPKYNNNFKYDIVFAGTHYGDQFPGSEIRLGAIRALQNAFGDKFCLYGSGFPTDVKTNGYILQSEINNVYADSMCVLSINNFNDTDYYFSDRLLMCLASGRPTISYRFPGCEKYFTHQNDLIIAQNIDEIVEAVNNFKKNNEMANKIGMNGYRIVVAEHSYTSRALELLQIISDGGNFTS
jgi:spore maturation protein CgeB